ncbi:MAG: thermonuclease family protein [Aquificaceae bacterium]
MSFILIALVLLLSCGTPKQKDSPVKDTVPCKVSYVVDGDTFHCKLPKGEEVRVRLVGIDTPESRGNPKARRDAERSGQSVEEIIRMGKLATEFTKRYLPKGEVVYLEFDVQRIDRHGRLLAYVWLSDGRMLNEVLVREGYAQVYTIPPNVKYQDRLLEAQRYARENKRGLWGIQ